MHFRQFIFGILIFCDFLHANEGLKYQCLEFALPLYARWTGASQLIHILEVDPELYHIRPVKALDDGLGRESVLSLSSRHEAIASVNGGFFGIGGEFDGQARGALKIQDWIALPLKPRGCIGWSSKDQNPKMDRVWVAMKVNCLGEETMIDGLNRYRQTGEAVLFTPSFHKSTLTLPDGEEAVVINGIIQSVIKGGSAKLPENGFILSIQDKHSLYGKLKEGESVSLSIKIDHFLEEGALNHWNAFDYIVGGTPLLIHQGLRILDYSSEKIISSFSLNKHARTAVGLLPNGHWVFVVVEKKGLFDGMTMQELGDFMEILGCVDALNLDGGDSSTMVYKEKIVNAQQDTRRVSDAIIIKPKNNTNYTQRDS